jgi:hypothetical protein
VGRCRAVQSCGGAYPAACTLCRRGHWRRAGRWQRRGSWARGIAMPWRVMCGGRGWAWVWACGGGPSQRSRSWPADSGSGGGRRSGRAVRRGARVRGCAGAWVGEAAGEREGEAEERGRPEDRRCAGGARASGVAGVAACRGRRKRECWPWAASVRPCCCPAIALPSPARSWLLATASHC